MKIEMLKEIAVVEQPVELPPMPRFLAAYVSRPISGNIRQHLCWGVTSELFATPDEAFADALIQGHDFETIRSSVRVFEIPGCDPCRTGEPETADLALDTAKTILGVLGRPGDE